MYGKIVKFAVALTGLLAVAACTAPLNDDPLIVRTSDPFQAEPDDLWIGSPAISPKGRYVAFGYHTIYGGKYRIAEFDRTTRQLMVLDLSEECEFSDPSHLPDGSGLVATKSCIGDENLDEYYGARCA